MKNGFQKLTAIFMTVLMFLAVIPVSAWGAEQYSNSVVPGISVLSILPGATNTITYIFQKKNGAEIARQIVKEGDTLLEPEVKTGENEKFVGWDPAVTFGTVGKIAKTETITVTAKIEKVYYIFFKDNTGRVVATKECTDGQTVSDFSDVTFPVGSDESITGWYFDADKTEKADSVTISGQNVMLYAKVEKGYWITFDANGGSYTAPVFYANGATAAAPATNPTLPGYSFDGWYLDKECKNEADFSKITTSTTVYAGWKAADTTYTVIHWQENADDNGYSYKESETKQGASGAQTAATAKSYRGFTAQTITQETIAGDGSTIVSVYYKRKLYDVKFYSYSSLFTTSKEYVNLRITAKYGANISDKWPNYNGSSAWATEDGGSTYQCNIDTMPFNGATFYGPKTGRGSETAYYYVEVLPGESGTVYNRVTYKLHHEDTSPGTDYIVSDEDKYPITGFTFKEFDATYGYDNWGQMYYNYDNAKFYYTRNSYEVIYMSNGAEDNKVSYKYQADISNAGAYEPATAPVGKEDYVFDGWYDDPNGQQKHVFKDKTMPAQNITVYAKWVPPTYKVTFIDQDNNKILLGTDLEGKPIYELVVAKGAKLDESQVPTIKLDEGETFLGWTLEDGTPFNLDTEINRNYELYARVGSQKGYSVEYDKNGATSGDAPIDDTKYAEGSYADVKLPGDLAKADKVFLGWALKEDAQKADYQPGDKLLIKADITLYAVWGDKPEQTKLTYNANFGETPPKKVYELENNATVTILDYGDDKLGLPQRPGYEFLGWSENSNATEVTYKAGDQIVVDATDAAKENILHAIWKQSTVTLTITKTVTGNFGDKNKKFEFEITFTDANGKSLRLVGNAPTYSITSDTTTAGGEKLSVVMKDGDAITLNNVPIGGTLVVREIEASGYQTSYKIGETETKGNAAQYTVPETGGTIAFINHRNVSPDTGVFVDSLPYILIIACVAAAGAFVVIRRRKTRED